MLTKDIEIDADEMPREWLETCAIIAKEEAEREDGDEVDSFLSLQEEEAEEEAEAEVSDRPVSEKPTSEVEKSEVDKPVSEMLDELVPSDNLN